MFYVVLFYSIGYNKRNWRQVRKKWQDLKSKGVTKNTKNKNQTGNLPAKELTKWEQQVLEFLEKRHSNIVQGVPEGLESTDTQVKYLSM